MRVRIAVLGTLLLAGLTLSGCLTGERPPLWTIYDDSTAQVPAVSGLPVPAVGGSTVVLDRRIEVYSLPAFSLRFGGFQAAYAPSPYFGHYPWYGSSFPLHRPVFGRPAPARWLHGKPGVCCDAHAPHGKWSGRQPVGLAKPATRTNFGMPAHRRGPASIGR